MRDFVADGNFKANHLKQKADELDIWLTSGEAFMTNETRYQMHLAQAQESKYVSHERLLMTILGSIFFVF